MQELGVRFQMIKPVIVDVLPRHDMIMTIFGKNDLKTAPRKEKNHYLKTLPQGENTTILIAEDIPMNMMLTVVLSTNTLPAADIREATDGIQGPGICEK